MATIELEYEVWTVVWNNGHRYRYRDYDRAKAFADRHAVAVLIDTPELVRRAAR